MKNALSLVALVAAIPAFAEDTRQLDAHEHGVGALNIAIEGTEVVMELHAPGADIVGFEYEAKSETDLAAIETAIASLSAPLTLFELPAAASCSVTSVSAELESEEAHDDHDEDKHDDHEEDAQDEHKHDEHDEEDHAEHKHDDHDEHSDDDHGHDDHDDHEKDAGHTEFHAEYALTCAAPDALTQIMFAYFDTFANALEVEVQLITSDGAQAFEVTRDTPVLKLER